MEQDIPVQLPKPGDPKKVDPLIPPKSENVADPLVSLTPEAKSNQLDEDAIKRRSSMYGFANYFKDSGQSTFEDILSSYEEQRNIAENSMRMLGDMELRRQIDYDALNKTIENISKFRVQNPESAGIVNQVALEAVTRRENNYKSLEAERQWAENLDLLRREGRNDLANLSKESHDTPGIFEDQVRVQSTRAMIMKMLEDNQKDMDNRFILWGLTDVLSTVVPFSSTWANSDNFDTEVKNWYDGFFSGERKAAEADSWWNAMLHAPSDTERQAIAQQFLNGLDRNTNWMFGQNKVLKEVILNELNARQEVFVTNVNDALLNAPAAIPLAKWAFKVPFKITNVLKGSGNSRIAVNKVLDAIEEIKKTNPQLAEKTTGVSLAEVEDNLLPDGVNPNKPRSPDVETSTVVKTTDTVPMTVMDIINNTYEDIKQLFGDLLFTERMTEAERIKAMEDIAERLRNWGVAPKTKRSGTSRKVFVKDYQLIQEPTPTGQFINTFLATIGKKLNAKEVADGVNPWYADQAAAERAASRMAVKYEIVPQEGGYGIKLWAPVDEGGRTLAGAPLFEPFKTKQTGGWSTFFSQHAGGKIAAAKEVYDAAGVAIDKRNLIIKHINDKILPAFFKMSPDEKSLLRIVLQQGERAGVWFGKDDLEVLFRTQFKDGNPTAFVEGYGAARRMNDIEYVLRNLSERISLRSQGYQYVENSMHGVKGAGKILRNTTEVPKEVIIQLGDDPGGNIAFVDEPVTKKRLWSKPRMSNEQLKKAQKDGYVLIRMQAPQRVFVGGVPAYSRYLLVRGSAATLNDIPHDIIPYRAGGHRMYKGQYFAKIPMRRQQPWGENVLDKPFTAGVSISKANGDLWVKEANRLIDEFNKFADNGGTDYADQLVEMQKLIDDAEVNFPDAAEFLEWMEELADWKTGKVLDKFELVFDREMHSSYQRTGVFSMVDEDLSGINTFLDTQGQMYKSHKGNILRDLSDWSTDGAETVDPFEMMNTAFANVARLSSFTDFKIRSINKWLSTYGHALDVRDMPDVNPMRMFLDAKFDTRTREGQLMAKQAEIQRNYIKRILSWKSDSDLVAEAQNRKLFEFVAGLPGPGKTSTAIHKLHNWWENTRPINAWMGMAFDSSMGFWNPGQLPLQMQTSFAALSIDSVNGLHAMGNMPAVMFYLRKAGTEADLKKMVEWGFHKINGFGDNPEAWMEMMRTLKKSGWMENMLATLKNEYGPNAALGYIGRGQKAVRQNGRIFVDKAEEWNRAVAWQIAWKRTMSDPAFKNLKMGTPAFNEQVSSLARTFAGNMDEASAAWWQKDIRTKLATQFMPYMIRWHEMLWNPDFQKIIGRTESGAVKVNLKSEKIRFVLGQYAMYGYAGLPFLAWAAAQQARATGQTSDINSMQGLLARGLWDSLIYHTTGADVSFSSRAGIGAYPTEIIGELFGQSQWGETSAADLALGASYQIGKDMAGALGRAMYYMANESGGDNSKPLTESAVMTVARHISTINNVAKAMAIINYGTYTNRAGQAIGKGLPDTYGFAALLGLNPAEVDRLTAQMGWLEDRKNTVKDWSKQIVIQRQQFANAIADGDYARADSISEAVNFMTRVLIPPELRKEVLAEANKDKDMKGVIQSVADRVTKEQSSDEFARTGKLE